MKFSDINEKIIGFSKLFNISIFIYKQIHHNILIMKIDYE